MIKFALIGIIEVGFPTGIDMILNLQFSDNVVIILVDYENLDRVSGLIFPGRKEFLWPVNFRPWYGMQL